MPEPFAIPPIVTVLPPISISTASSFSQVSVVIIAFAASVLASIESDLAAANFSTPAWILSIGSCFPITPVEPKSTASAGIPNTSLALSAVS